jgi:hypothetical protein
LGLEAGELEQGLRRAGARQVGIFGGYRGEPYTRDTSGDLLVVAER